MRFHCDSCDSMLAVPDDCTEEWIEHHADGSHTHHMFAAWAGDALDSAVQDHTDGREEA